MLSTNKVVYVCRVSKLQHMYLILLNTFHFTKDHKTHQIISNLNRTFWNKLTLIWVGFLEFLFNPLAQPSFITMPSFESGYISSILYMQLFWPIFILTLYCLAFPFCNPRKHQKNRQKTSENIKKSSVSMGIKGNIGQ